MKYRAEIDGLRAIAVVPVILFHASFEFLSGGFVGVDVFFVISGYLITIILVEDIENNRFSIVSFYERRARRILPALYLVLFLTAIASLFVLYPEDLVSFAKSLIATPLFASNFYFWSERGYFGGEAEFKPLIHTWSLAVEEQFYIVFPIFILLLRKYVKTFYSLLVIAFVLSLACSYYVTLLHFDTGFYFPLTRAWEILLGSFAALIIKYRPFSMKSWLADLVSLLGLALIFYAYFEFDSETLFPYVSALIPVFGTFLFIVTSQHSALIKNVLSQKVLVYIGLISFSLYLWHQPIFALARQLGLFENNLVVLLLLTVLLSYLSFQFVEKPFRNKSITSPKTVLVFSVSGALILIALGVVTITKNGFPDRYKAEDRELLIQLANYKGYNQKRFDALKFRQFDDDTKYNVVIIGDSYAKDFLNIIVESKQFEDYEFSTRQVNSDCGNLYLENYDVITGFVPHKMSERCKVLGRYEGKDFFKILSDANEIWIVSDWKDWVVEYLPDSVTNLGNDFGKPVRVFGIKDFGDILPYALLDVPPAERASYTQSVSDDSSRTSDLLRDKMKAQQDYYPLLDNLCGGKSAECRIFTPSGLLMSADGGHLTREGATEAALRMSETLMSIKMQKQN